MKLKRQDSDWYYQLHEKYIVYGYSNPGWFTREQITRKARQVKDVTHGGRVRQNNQRLVRLW